MTRSTTKWRNRKTTIDGITFDSVLEARRYCDLKLMERAGEIRDLELQPGFELLPSFRDKTGKLHRAIKYIADFRYTEVATGLIIVEDVKGMETREFKMKRKLLLSRYPETNLRITA